MDFEKLLKKNSQLAPVGKQVADEVLAGSPVTSNTSGFTQDEIVLSIGKHAVVVPTIGGVAQRATVVMEADVVNKSGQQVKRLLFLSTLLRKINLDAPYKGLIATGPAFAKSEEFTNEDWIKAFKASTPFKATEMAEIMRPANVRGEMRDIRVRELTLESISEKDAKAAIAATPADETASKEKK